VPSPMDDFTDDTNPAIQAFRGGISATDPKQPLRADCLFRISLARKSPSSNPAFSAASEVAPFWPFRDSRLIHVIISAVEPPWAFMCMSLTQP